MVAIFSKEVDNLKAVLVQAGHDGDGQISEPEPQHTAQSCGSQPPDFGGWSPSLSNMSQHLLHILLGFQLSSYPLLLSIWLACAIDEGSHVDVCLLERLKEDREELEHVVPLPAAAPVAVEAAIQAIKSGLCIQDKSKSAGAPSNLSRHELSFKD